MFKSRHNDFIELRKRYQHFHFHGYKINRDGDRLRVTFHFEIEGLQEFHPSWDMPSVDNLTSNQLLLNNLVFHLGMVELVSYWKLTCSPLVHVHPYRLSKAQEIWWKKLYFNGLGEFRYLNGIDATMPDFLQFGYPKDTGPVPDPVGVAVDDSTILVPVGGGKDSAVSLHLLGSIGLRRVPFMINPIKASLDMVAASRVTDEAIVYRRTLDPRLLSLNEQGFLNGHTPFSALVAFSSLLAAAGAGLGTITLSNEASANEDTIPGTGINHQYSKSYEFESDFRLYLGEYISPSFNYLSFLRPLSELAIAGLFAKMPHYHGLFRSCNAGSKNGVWCGKCSKCLFTFIMLSPYLTSSHLREIFGRNLLDDESLLPLLDELAGITSVKPFECIGTIDEVRLALGEMIRNPQFSDSMLIKARDSQLSSDSEAQRLAGWRKQLSLHFPNFLTSEWISILQTRLNELLAERMDRGA